MRTTYTYDDRETRTKVVNPQGCRVNMIYDDGTIKVRAIEPPTKEPPDIKKPELENDG